MTKHRILLSGLLAIVMVTAALAEDATGIWTASFDTQVGVQKYTYTFKVAGNKLTGKAKSELAMTETDIVESAKIGSQMPLFPKVARSSAMRNVGIE